MGVVFWQGFYSIPKSNKIHRYFIWLSGPLYLDDSDDKELELEKDGDWNLRIAKKQDEYCDDSNLSDEYSGDDEGDNTEDEESEPQEDAIEILDDTQRFI